MSDLIHIISWERFCQRDNLNDLDKYAQFPMARYPGLLDIRNLNIKQTGPLLQEMPENCLPVLIEKSSLLLDHRHDSDSISGVDIIFKLLCLMARNYKNIDKLDEYGAINVVVKYMELTMTNLAKDIDMDWMNLFEYLLYFLEIVYDPTFSWRRRKKLYFSETEFTADYYSSTVKVLPVTNSIVTWMCSHLSKYCHERDILNRLLHLLCSILSGSKHNAQLLISPAVVDTFTFQSDINTEIMASFCFLITCLSKIATSQRQEDMSVVVLKLLRLFTEKPELRIHDLRCLSQMCDVSRELCDELVTCGIFPVFDRCLIDSKCDKHLRRMTFSILSKLTAGSWQVREQFIQSSGYETMLEILMKHVAQSASLLDMVFSWAVCSDFDASKVSISSYVIRDGHVVSLLVKWATVLAISLDEDSSPSGESVAKKEILHWKAIFKLLMELCSKSRSSLSECCGSGVISVLCHCIRQACQRMDDSVPAVMDYDDEDQCRRVADSKRICDDLLNGLFHLLEMFSGYSVNGSDLASIIRLFKDKHSRSRGRRIIKMFNNIVSEGHLHEDIDCWFEFYGPEDCIQIFPVKEIVNFTLGLNNGNFGEAISHKTLETLDGKINANGFSFHCWLNLTPKSVIEKVNSGHERSCIFRLITENCNGFEAFLNMDGQLLIATCHQGEFHYVQVTSKSSGRRPSFYIEENLLKYNKWHMLDLVFQNARGFLRKSTVSVYIDGLLINTLDLKYPVINEKISVFHISGCPKSISNDLLSTMNSKFKRKSGFLNNNSLKRTWIGEEHNVWGRLSTLKCRMTSVACINDIITDQIIGNLFTRGYHSSQAIIGDESLCNTVLVNYHSLAFDHSDNCCLNMHPYILSSRCSNYLSGHLRGERLSSLKLQAAFNEIGGVSALLPIIEQLDFMQLSSDVEMDNEDGYRFKENSPNRFIGRMVSSSSTEERFITVPDRNSDEQLDDSILASIVILLRKMSLVGVNQQMMERSKCIEIIGGFLQKIETIFLDMNVVIAFHSLADQCGPSLSAKIYQLIILDWRIWSRCNKDTRLKHALFVSNLVKHELSMFRTQYGIGFFLDLLEFYHKPCLIDGVDSDWTIRQQLYDIVYILVHKHANAADFQKIIRFIHECNNDLLIQELLTLLTRLFETEKSVQDCILFYDCKLMETLMVLLVRDLSVSTKEETIKFLHLLITSHRVPDKHKDHLLLVKVSYASIFIYKQFYDSPLSCHSIQYLLDILRKSAVNDLFGAVQFLSLLTMSPIEQRVSALKMLQSIFDKSPDAIFAISEQPGWQDILIHLLVLKRREKDETSASIKDGIKTEEVILRSKDDNATGFRRSHTWAFDVSVCDNSLFVQSKIDGIIEEKLHSTGDNIADKGSLEERDMKEDIAIFCPGKNIDGMEYSRTDSMMQGSVCESVSGSEDTPHMLKPDEAMTSLQCRESADREWYDAQTEQLIDLVLQTLHKVMWSVLSPASEERVWMIVHQVLESLRSVNERYVMLKSMSYFKQRILIGLLKSTINYWKSIDSYSQYKVMHATELIRLIVDSSGLIDLDQSYRYDSELLDLTITLLQECLQVWDDNSSYPELSGLGFYYLLSLSYSHDTDILSAVCARLHHVITTLSKNISYEEIAFILVHLDRILTTVIDNENYYFIAPILKTLLEHHEDMLQLSTYLGSLALRTPDFYDHLKEYCGQLEWKTFIKSRLYSACEIYESSCLNVMTTKQSLWRAEANERMSVDRKKRVAICAEHKKLFEGDIVQLTVSWIKDEHRRKEHKMVDLQNQHDSALKQWRIVKQSLTSSKGCWHDEAVPTIMRLKQSYRENYLRMRPRFEINYQFDDHRGASNERDHPRRSLKEPEPDPLRCLSVLEGKIDFSALGDDQLGDDEWISVQNIEQTDANHNTTNSPKQASGPKKCLFECRCKLIALTDVIDGRFELTNTHFIFQGSTPSSDSQDLNNSKIMCPIVQIREVHLRRYNLRRSAIEIFLTDQTNYFFNYDAKIRDRVYSKILSLRPPNLVYSKQRSPAEMLKCSGLTQRWVTREISNFEYLMQLNTIAGRTYNDLSQYPVFPWILADYTSEKLDLDNPNTFRDLSKPIGIVNPKNENEVREKYDGFEDPSGVIAKFHYGTHYSSAAGVMHYLVRMEPFATMHIQLQGGKFDVADRQFHSIPLSWRFIMECPSDNKELIPEFFYQPQFLRNTNGFDFGKLQLTKTPIDDVQLPAWAKSPEDFIFQHRQALESEHVSLNLHNWIDLIFGYKQKGLEAVKALNVFYYVTYEGVVDLDQIDDPYERESIESMINNFGQTPCQLMKTAHPRRMTSEEVRCQMIKVDKYLPVVSNIGLLKHTSKSICRASEPIVFVRVPLAQVRSLIGPDRALSMVTIHSSNIVARHNWTPNSKGTGPGYYIDVDPIFDSPSARRRNYLGVLDSCVKSSNQLYTLTPDGRYVIAGGNIENCLTILPLMKRCEPYYSTTPHHKPISCVAIDLDAVSSSNSVMTATGSLAAMASSASSWSSVLGGKLYGLTGSLDTTCVIWDWSDLQSVAVNHVLCGHCAPVTCVALSVYLDVAVSASRDGTVNLHSVTKGQFLHTITPSSPVPLVVNLVVLNRLGHIYVQWQNSSHSNKQFLSLYSLHGHHISTGDLGNDPVTVVTTPAKCPGSVDVCVMVGNSKGELSILDGHDLDSELHLLRFSHSILDVSLLTPGGQYLAVALSNGQLIISAVSLLDLDPGH